MKHELKKRIFTSILLLCLLITMHLYSFVMIISLIVIAMIVWIEFYSLLSKILPKDNFKDKLLRFVYKASALLYLSILVYFIIGIEPYYPNLKIYLLYSVLVAILSDIGGLIFGKIFKGIKLTKISPNKTVSGSIGSLVFSLTLLPIFYEKLIIINFSSLALITIIISITSQLGDLFISLLKRKAKVKNTSDILPGHGGFLDRVDGIIFAIPMGILLFTTF
jgi:phosphatidate cytidylyltransferase